jgi:hypothetical protein
VEEAFDAFEKARKAFDEIGSPYEAARCLMAASRLFDKGKGKVKARAADLAEAARRSFATLGAADLEA